MLIESLPLFSTAGHHFLDFANNTLVVISTKELYDAYQTGDNSPLWTFSTLEGSRIRFTFTSFGFSTFYSNFLEIGDGLVRGNATRLAHFTGYDTPSNVTSVSSKAWLSVYLPCVI